MFFLELRMGRGAFLSLHAARRKIDARNCATAIKRATSDEPARSGHLVGAQDMHVAKAVWFIESHFAGPVEVADAFGVSRHHLSRTFHRATGRSLSAYLRGRRLSEAARSLAGGAPDILAVAIEAQYGSHEAFTRAFRDQFGLTPEEVRRRGDFASLDIVEPLSMYAETTTELSPPALRTVATPVIAGIDGAHLRRGLQPSGPVAALCAPHRRDPRPEGPRRLWRGCSERARGSAT